MVEQFRSIKDTDATICMGHLELNGFEMHKGHFSENGYPKEIFKDFPTVFSGHFHKKSDDGTNLLSWFYISNDLE